jgi:hypothetical protein
MNPKIMAALVGLIAAVVSVKLPALGDAAATNIATAIVSFVVGYILPAPGSATKVD